MTSLQSNLAARYPLSSSSSHKARCYIEGNNGFFGDTGNSSGQKPTLTGGAGNSIVENPYLTGGNGNCNFEPDHLTGGSTISDTLNNLINGSNIGGESTMYSGNNGNTNCGWETMVSQMPNRPQADGYSVENPQKPGCGVNFPGRPVIEQAPVFVCSDTIVPRPPGRPLGAMVPPAGFGLQAGADFAEQVANGLQAVGSAVYSGVQAVGNAVSNGVQAVGNAVSNGVQAVGNAVSNGVQAVGNAVSNGVQAVGNAISSGVQAVGNFLSNIF